MEKDVHVSAQEESLASKLRRHRLRVGYTQGNVAEVLNITRSTYTYYESGRTSPDPATLNRIAKLFGVSVEEFFNDEPSQDVLFDPEGEKRRAPKKVKSDPEKIAELATGERSVVAFMRDRGISPEQALEILRGGLGVNNKQDNY